MLTKETVTICQRKLLDQKKILLNQVRTTHSDFILTTQEKSMGDEGDQSVRMINEQALLNTRDRLLNQLFEIENALSRIELGTYGICEETHEPIETERLIALPWTRLSIEGAEIREAVSKRYGGPKQRESV